MHINFKFGKKIIFVLITLILITGTSYAVFDTTTPWHPLQRVRTTATSSFSVDDAGNGVIDDADSAAWADALGPAGLTTSQLCQTTGTACPTLVTSVNGISGLVTINSTGNVIDGFTTNGGSATIRADTIFSNLTVNGTVVGGDVTARLARTGANSRTWAIRNSVNNLQFYDESAATTPFTIEPNTPTNTLFLNRTGNVGIGIVNPAQKLDVAGQIHATGDICTDASGGKCLSASGGGGVTSLNGLQGDLQITTTGGLIDTINPASPNIEIQADTTINNQEFKVDRSGEETPNNGQYVSINGTAAGISSGIYIKKSFGVYGRASTGAYTNASSISAGVAGDAGRDDIRSTGIYGTNNGYSGAYAGRFDGTVRIGVIGSFLNISDDGDSLFNTNDRIEFQDDGTTYAEFGTGASEGNFQLDNAGNLHSNGNITLDFGGYGAFDGLKTWYIGTPTSGGNSVRVQADLHVGDTSQPLTGGGGHLKVFNRTTLYNQTGIGKGPSSTDMLRIWSPDSYTLRLEADAPTIRFQRLVSPFNTWAIQNLGTLTFIDNAGNQPFKIEDGTSSNTLYLGSTGNVGIRATAPFVDLAIADDNTGLDLASADNLGIYTGGSERVRVDSSGNVGIGDTSPDAKLDIENTGAGTSFRVDDQASDTTPFVVDASGNVGIQTQTSSIELAVGDSDTGFNWVSDGDLRIDSNGANRIEIDGNGVDLTGTTINLFGQTSTTGDFSASFNNWEAPTGFDYPAGAATVTNRGSASCPAGYYVIGIEVWDDDGGSYCVGCLTGVKLRCAKL